MRAEPTFENLLAEIDSFVELKPSDAIKASERGVMLSRAIIALKDVVKLNPKNEGEMGKLASTVDRAATQLTQSALNFKRGGVLRADWVRFAQRDMRRLKDGLLAFREFMLTNAAAFKSWMQAHAPPNIALEKLVRELHEERAISERTFVLLMAHLAKNGRVKLKPSPTVAQLSRISAYLTELQKIRSDADVQQK